MAVGSDTGSSGVLTVLFTDIENSTDMTNRTGDAAAREVMSIHDRIVRDQVEGNGGRQVKNLGDGVMASFASARKAVACAAGIQRELEEHNRAHPGQSLSVRVGLNAGEVVDENDDIFGAAVNAASRIAAKAGGGEVLVAEVVKQLAGKVEDIDFHDRGRFRLRGFDERWRLYEVKWQQEKTAAPVLPAETVPLVGREADKAQLMSFVDKAIAGQGALVMLGGEAGVGKTRLTSEVAAEAAAKGMLVLTGHCYEMEGAPPYIPMVEILEAGMAAVDRETFRTALGEDAGEIARIVPGLRRTFDDIPPALELPADQERHYLFNSVRDFVTRASSITPIMLVYEDLHWADEPTLLMGEHIAGKLAELPVLIIGTYRDVDLEVSRPMARSLESLLRARLAERISLKRLEEGGVAEMIKNMSGQAPPASLVAAVFEETEGNPFFVHEVFQYLAEENRLFDEAGKFRADLSIGELEVPESVRLVIGRRLDRLGEAGRKVLGGAAVIGREFTYKLLAQLSEIDEDTLLDVVDEAERAHLIEAVDGAEARFMFAHELIRQTLLSDLSLPRRQRLHKRVAAAIEAVAGNAADDFAIDLAHHMYQAGEAADPDKTAHYLLLATDRALGAAAFEEAEANLERLGSLELDDKRLQADIKQRLGLVKRSLGAWPDAIEAWDSALSLYEELGDGEAAAWLASRSGEQMAWATRWEDAIVVVGRGLGALGDTVNEDRGTLLAMAGIAFSGGGNYEAAETMIREAETIADELDLERLKGIVLGARTIHHFLYQEAEKCWTTGLAAGEVLGRSGNIWWQVSVMAFVVLAGHFSRHHEEAVSICDEHLPTALKLGNHGAALSYTRFRDVRELQLRGDLPTWERASLRDLELSQQIDSVSLIADAHTFLGLHHFYAGDWAAAAEELKQGAEQEAPGAYGGNAGGWLNCSAVMGDTEAVRSWIDANWDELAKPGQPNSMSSWAKTVGAASALWLLGDRDRCAELLPAIDEYRATGVERLPYVATSLASATAVASAAAGKWDAIDGLIDEAFASEAWTDGPAWAEDRQTLATLLMARDQAGDRDRARQILTDVLASCERIGMPRHATMAQELLAKT